MVEGRNLSVPGEDIDRRLRRPLWLGGLLLGCAVALAAWSWFEWREDRVLHAGGPRTDAEVIDTDYRRRRPDALEVRYDVDGKTYQVEMPGDISGHDPGERIEVVYDPNDPSHARPVEGWSPAHEFLLLIPATLAIASPGLWLYDRHPARQAVEAIHSGDVETMWAVRFRRWTWLRGGYQQLAALSPGEAIGEEPELMVELDARFAKHLEEGPVQVFGELRPGGPVVLRQRNRTVWTVGKVRRELPAGAKPLATLK